MTIINNACCPNKDCKDFGLLNKDNIRRRGKYGKDKTRDLLYCKTCGHRFCSTNSSPFKGLHLPDEKIQNIIHHAAEGVGVRATGRMLSIDKDTVNRVIFRAGKHCEFVLSNLLKSLKLQETQLDELWTFVKKRVVKTNMTPKSKMEESGSGPQ